jgi:hypothetical protein
MPCEWPQIDAGESEALLLELLDMPISFHRCLVPLTGKVTAALLLSYLLWNEDEARPDPAGWVTRPLDRLREETGLSKDELGSARRALRALGILEERRLGMPPRVEFRINRRRIAQLLVEQVGSARAPHPGPNAEDCPHGNLPH